MAGASIRVSIRVVITDGDHVEQATFYFGDKEYRAMLGNVRMGPEEADGERDMRKPVRQREQCRLAQAILENGTTIAAFGSKREAPSFVADAMRRIRRAVELG